MPLTIGFTARVNSSASAAFAASLAISSRAIRKKVSALSGRISADAVKMPHAGKTSELIEVALGALSNSPSAQAATRYAYDKGVTLAVVSSDLNTANHNYPTNYAETIEVNGVVADTYGLGAAEANEFGLPLSEVGVGGQAKGGSCPWKCGTAIAE